MGTGKYNAGGNLAMDWHPSKGGVEIASLSLHAIETITSCKRNPVKLRPHFLQRFGISLERCSYIRVGVLF